MKWIINKWKTLKQKFCCTWYGFIPVRPVLIASEWNSWSILSLLKKWEAF